MSASLLRRYRAERGRLASLAVFPVLQEGVWFDCLLDEPRRRNLALQSVNEKLLRWFDPSLPHILHVGVTTHCNLRCPACPTGTKALGRPRTHLDVGVWRGVLDELRDSLLFALFWDWGEPFMHPRLPELIQLAGAQRVRSVISTNGTVANAPARLERLVGAKPDLVIVCVDGASQETYQRYRIGGRLREALATVERLVAARRRLGQTHPVVEFRSLATRYTENELPELLHLAEETGADFFSLKSLRPYDYRGSDVDGELVPLTADLARYAYEGEIDAATRRHRDRRIRCRKPIHAPTLNAEGELVFCSYARHADENFGDVSNGGFRRLWRSRAARALRRNFLASNGTGSCDGCYFRAPLRPTVLQTVELVPLPQGLRLDRPQSRDGFLAGVAA
jgi:MoaA/NifB/PqqE/SkfB family radical SAM enzyme